MVRQERGYTRLAFVPVITICHTICGSLVWVTSMTCEAVGGRGKANS